MDECAYRRRTFHRVRKPDIQRELRRLTRCADEKEQTDRREYADSSEWFCVESRTFAEPREYTGEIDAIECQINQNDREDESEVSDAIHDESLLSGVCGGFSCEPKSD